MATPILKSANPATNPAVSTPPQRPALRSETRPQATEARGANEAKRTESRRGAERPDAGNAPARTKRGGARRVAGPARRPGALQRFAALHGSQQVIARIFL